MGTIIAYLVCLRPFHEALVRITIQRMILVTGATGFIGQSLVQALRDQDRPVKPYTEKLNDALALPAELSGVDAVIHLAGAESHGRLRLLQRVDVEGTEVVLIAPVSAGEAEISDSRCLSLGL